MNTPTNKPAKVPMPDGWALLASDGTTADFRPRVREFFGAILDDDAPLFDADDITRRDREWPGLAPHRCVPVYFAAQPAPEVPADRAALAIPGLGRMTDDDDGFVTLQFVSEEAATAFMRSYEPSVDVEQMPRLAAAPEAPAQPGAPDAVDALVAAGHVTAEKAAQARAIVAPFAQPVQGEPVADTAGDAECRFALFWNHKRATFTTTRQAARAAFFHALETVPAAPAGPTLTDAEPTDAQIALLDPWMRPQAARELLRKVLAARTLHGEGSGR